MVVMDGGYGLQVGTGHKKEIACSNNEGQVLR